MTLRRPLCLCLLLGAGALSAQAGAPAPAPGDTVVVRPIGGRYAGGWLRRLLLGSDYRALWALPVSIPVLDLAGYGGGLTPVSRGGGQQTTSLRLRAADGREFYFRSIDKDPSPNLPPELLGTVVAGVVQDQVSSALPTAPLVVAPLLEAAGVPHGTPELYILPDDPRLGEHRAALAGLVGMLEPRIAAGWAGAAEVISGEDLFTRIERSPDDRVDVQALLTARLVDILVGDWDRHRDQWSWMRGDGPGPRRWIPVPRDRDFAMVSYDGLLLAIARMELPQLITFRPDYPGTLGLTWNGRELDRVFLTELEWPAWDSTAHAVQAAISDSVIEVAVSRLPPEHRARIGAALVVALRARRDDLPRAAARFYRMLAAEAEVHATDADEVATVQPDGADGVEVSLRRGNEAGAAPYFVRRYRRGETGELRLFLRGGGDSVVVRGPRHDGIRIRVIGGAGEDALLDSARAGRLDMYDADGGTVVRGRAGLDRRPYVPPPKRTPTEIPPRDWGHRWQSGALLTGGPDIGVLLGASRTLTTYGFRSLPFASRHRFRAGVATGPWTYRADYKGEFRRQNSSLRTEIHLRASGIDVLRFHGFGNELPATGSKEFYRVTQQQYGLSLALARPLGRHAEITVGAGGRYVSTDDRAGRYLTTLDPYGDGQFGVLGAHAEVSMSTRRVPGGATTGVDLVLGGGVYPAWWDVRKAYGEGHAEAVTTLNLPAPLAPSLHLRLGGKRLWGSYPYFDAAFLGSGTTVRLGRENRYAGDAAVWANSELRLRLGRLFVGAPGDFGVLGLADVGRVFLAGESSDQWHGAAGGGVWLSVLDRSNVVSASVARSAERTALYFQAGFGF